MVKEIKYPSYVPSLCLLIGGILEVILFSVGDIYGYLGIIFLIIGAYILWR